MNLRKGLTLIAFGFLFTLIDLNLTLNGKTLNVTPDFIGWILMYLTIDNLGDYADRKPILKADYLLLAILSLGLYIAEIIRPELAISKYIQPIINIVSVISMFMLFTRLERIAHDYNPNLEPRIRNLKFINLLLHIAILVFVTVFADRFASLSTNIGQSAQTISIILIILLAALIIFTIITAFTLFKLRKSVNE